MVTMRLCHLLLLLAVALMALPVSAQPPCEMTPHHDDDPCHTQDTPLDNNCCDTGCADCGLPCCTGLATVLADPPTLIASTCVRKAALLIGSRPALGDPEPIYHPPRT